MGLISTLLILTPSSEASILKLKRTHLLSEIMSKLLTHFHAMDGFYKVLSSLGMLFNLGSTELVLEYAETNKIEEAERWMVGVNYWLDPRSVIKVGYEDTDVVEGPDDTRFAVQFSYGF